MDKKFPPFPCGFLAATGCVSLVLLVTSPGLGVMGMALLAIMYYWNKHPDAW